MVNRINFLGAGSEGRQETPGSPAHQSCNVAFALIHSFAFLFFGKANRCNKLVWHRKKNRIHLASLLYFYLWSTPFKQSSYWPLSTSCSWVSASKVNYLCSLKPIPLTLLTKLQINEVVGSMLFCRVGVLGFGQNPPKQNATNTHKTVP